LFKVSPGLDGKNTSVCFLTEHIFGPLGGTTTFEECKSSENSFFFIVELLQDQVDVEGAGGGDTGGDGIGWGGVFSMGKERG